MQSQVLVDELGALVRRLEHRINTTPQYSQVLQTDTTDDNLQLTLEGIEDAICGLVMLHINLRKAR